MFLTIHSLASRLYVAQGGVVDRERTTICRSLSSFILVVPRIPTWNGSGNSYNFETTENFFTLYRDLLAVFLRDPTLNGSGKVHGIEKSENLAFLSVSDRCALSNIDCFFLTVCKSDASRTCKTSETKGNLTLSHTFSTLSLVLWDI